MRTCHPPRHPDAYASEFWFVFDPCTCPYHYGRKSLAARPFPTWLVEIRDGVMKACGVLDRRLYPDSCHVKFYDNGKASLGWHVDDELLFGQPWDDVPIIAYSLGVERTFQYALKRKASGGVHEVTLKNGDILIMDGAMQSHYVHRVPADKRVKALRVNLTFRWIRNHESECQCHAGRESSRSRSPGVGSSVERFAAGAQPEADPPSSAGDSVGSFSPVERGGVRRRLCCLR